MPELPPIIVGTRKPWASPGIAGKPGECASCAFTLQSSGFCPDWRGSHPKLALLFTSPSADEVTEREPLKSDMGGYIFRHFLAPFGLTKDDLIVSHVLRCKAPWDRRRMRVMYPIGKMREKCEVTCRIYDDRHGVKGALTPSGLLTFSPNIAIITFSPKDCIKVGAYYRQVKNDIGKAVGFAGKGYKPLVCFGNEPAELIFPHIVGHGSVKQWHGHFAEMEYKWKTL